jgi:hypothetical protein
MRNIASNKTREITETQGELKQEANKKEYENYGKLNKSNGSERRKRIKIKRRER